MLVSQAGFSDQGLASLVGWTALGAFALVTTVATLGPAPRLKGHTRLRRQSSR